MKVLRESNRVKGTERLTKLLLSIPFDDNVKEIIISNVLPKNNNKSKWVTLHEELEELNFSYMRVNKPAIMWISKLRGNRIFKFIRPLTKAELKNV